MHRVSLLFFLIMSCLMPASAEQPNDPFPDQVDIAIKKSGDVYLINTIAAFSCDNEKCNEAINIWFTSFCDKMDFRTVQKLGAIPDPIEGRDLSTRTYRGIKYRSFSYEIFGFYLVLLLVSILIYINIFPYELFKPVMILSLLLVLFFYGISPKENITPGDFYAYYQLSDSIINTKDAPQTHASLVSNGIAREYTKFQMTADDRKKGEIIGFTAIIKQNRSEFVDSIIRAFTINSFLETNLRINYYGILQNPTKTISVSYYHTILPNDDFVADSRSDASYLSVLGLDRGEVISHLNNFKVIDQQYRLPSFYWVVNTSHEFYICFLIHSFTSLVITAIALWKIKVKKVYILLCSLIPLIGDIISINWIFFNKRHVKQYALIKSVLMTFSYAIGLIFLAFLF